MPWLISAGVGLAETISGEVNKNKTDDNAAELGKTRPKIQRDPLTDQNLSLVKSDLASGMSAKAEAAYNNIVDSQFSSSLSALLKGGGDVNSVGDIYGASEDGRQKLAIMKDNLRLNQIKNVLYQSERADERNYVTPWQVNEQAPWADKASANADARTQADDRIWKGIGELASSGMQGLQAGKEDDQFGDKQDFNGTYGSQSKGAYRYAKRNRLSYDQYNAKGYNIGKRFMKTTGF